MSLAASIRKPAAWRRAGAARGAGRRRGAVVLLLALAYAAGTLVFLLGGRLSGGGAAVEVASSSLHPRRHAAGGHPPSPPQPGSVYRSHLVFERLWPAMRDDATAAASASSLSASSSWRRSMVSYRCSLPLLSSDHTYISPPVSSLRVCWGIAGFMGCEISVLDSLLLLRLFLGFAAKYSANFGVLCVCLCSLNNKQEACELFSRFVRWRSCCASQNPNK